MCLGTERGGCAVMNDRYRDMCQAPVGPIMLAWPMLTGMAGLTV
jgi:hypothetical protein